MDAVQLAPGVTPNTAHLPAASSEAKQHRKAGGEECNNKRNIALSETVAVVEGETCTTSSNLSEAGRVPV